jgi:IS5 family transposase
MGNKILSLMEDGCETLCGFLRLNNTADPRAAIRQARREEREDDRRRDRELKRRNKEETLRLTQAVTARRLASIPVAGEQPKSKGWFRPSDEKVGYNHEFFILSGSF